MAAARAQLESSSSQLSSSQPAGIKKTLPWQQRNNTITRSAAPSPPASDPPLVDDGGLDELDDDDDDDGNAGLDETASDGAEHIAELVEDEGQYDDDYDEEEMEQQRHYEEVGGGVTSPEEDIVYESSNKYVTNYDTAVLAAKNAIDLSNQSRTWRQYGAPSPDPPSNEAGRAVATRDARGTVDPIGVLQQPEEFVRDPSLQMEPSPNASPSSSLVEEEGEDQDESAETAGEDRIAQLNKLLTDDDVASPTVAKTPQGQGFFQADAFASNNIGSDQQHVKRGEQTPQEDFFGPSFMSQQDQNVDFQPEPQQEENLQSTDPFSSDPFDPFSTGEFSYQHQDAQTGGETPAREDTPGHNESERHGTVRESPLFEAIFGEDAPATPSTSNNATAQDEYYSPEETRGFQPSSLLLTPLSNPDGSDLLSEPLQDLSGIEAQSSSYESNEDFDVNVPNFAEQDVGSSISEVDVASKRQLPGFPQHIPGGGQIEAGNDEADSSCGSFKIRPLNVYLAPERDAERIADPIQNPLSGNIIVCRMCNGGFSIEELSEENEAYPTAIVSTKIISNELKNKMARISPILSTTKVLGVSKVLTISAGVHRVQGKARVRVAAMIELLVAAKKGIDTLRIVTIYKWGYSGSSTALLQSVLTTHGIDDTKLGGYNPKTLAVADGILFLGGHLGERETTPAVFVAKPAVRSSWTSIPIGLPMGDTRARIVSALAVSNNTTSNDAVNHFVALGLDDGTVTVLLYDMAVKTNRLVDPSQASSLLQPLCLIRGKLDIAGLNDQDCLWPDERFFSTVHRGSSNENAPAPSPTNFVLESDARCTSLSWMQHSASGVHGLPLLACAFSSGVSVYHVMATSSNPTSPNLIAPLAAAKFISYIEETDMTNFMSTTNTATAKCLKPMAKVGWYDLGPRSPPCLTLLFQHTKLVYQKDGMELVSKRGIDRLCLCAIDLPWYGSSDMGLGAMSEEDGPGETGAGDDKPSRPRAIGVISQRELNMEGSSAKPNNSGTIVGASSVGCITCYSRRSLLSCKPAFTSTHTFSDGHPSHEVDGYFSSLLRPVASASLGVDTTGSISRSHTAVKEDYRDTILTVFSVMSCGGKNELTVPSQRHWLMISAAGDCKIEGLGEQNPSNSAEEVESGLPQISSDERVRGGATTNILFELTCGENPVAGLVPTRILKEEGGRRVAVIFSSGIFGGNFTDESEESSRIRTQTRPSHNAVAYTILDIEDGLKNRGSTNFQLRYGRDVAFLPPKMTEGGFYCSTLVVLDHDGSTLSVTTAITSTILPEGENERVVESIQKCSLQYEGIEGHRVFALFNNGSSRDPEILLAGHSKVVGRPCLLLSKHRLEKESVSNQLTMVEDTGLGHRLWLRPGEDILSVVELPLPPPMNGKENISTRANLAVASQQRVMIISVDDDNGFSIISEIEVQVTCASLSPLGSHCVAFSGSVGGAAQIMYLSCLENKGSRGVISTLPSLRRGKTQTLLAAIRPDRLVYLSSHGSLRVIEDDEDDFAFVTPLPSTRPLFLLEPLVANALCQDKCRGMSAGNNNGVQVALRTVIEKFGRKEIPFPHGENQGIGTFGAGITKNVYNLLTEHKCHNAASTLLTGSIPNDLVSQQKLLPPWIPMQTKLSAAGNNVDLIMQVLASGDGNLAQYLLHLDEARGSALPGPLDVTSVLAEEMALGALKHGSSSDAIKLLDLAGRPSSESLLAQLALTMDSQNILQDITSGSSAEAINKHALLGSSLGLKLMNKQSGTSPEKDGPIIPVSHLAPSVQSAWDVERVRNAFINRGVVESGGSSDSLPVSDDITWKQAINKNKHIWSSGPFGKKESLLELDDFEDWLGRCCPPILGKEGVAVAADTGEHALADILARDGEEADAASVNSDKTSVGSRQTNWVEGIGEGRLDEDNLSFYIRFSEGADEDGNWKADGFPDLTKNAHITRLYGSELASVEATTSSVDEGEEGKIKLLYDLVYNEGAPREEATGVVVEAPRGGSLDIGMLHSAQHTSRQRCTIELWYHLPQAGAMTDDIILVRRSLFYEDNGDATKLCLPDENHNTLWELAVLPTGLLELRTGAGSVVTSTSVIGDEDNDTFGHVAFERDDGGGGWNHVALVFSSLAHSSPTECSASILMNGVLVVPEASISVNPFGSESGDLNQDDIEDAMEKTVFIFGIGPSVGFRITDIRVWACQRAEDDVRLMMYEYLKDAEIRRKLKVNIRKGARKSSIGGLLPPKLSKKGFALAPPPRPSPDSKRSLPAAETNIDDAFMPSFANFADSADGESQTFDVANEAEGVNPPEVATEADITPSFANFEEEVVKVEPQELNNTDQTAVKEDPPEEIRKEDPPEESLGDANESTESNAVVTEAQTLNRAADSEDDSSNLDPQNEIPLDNLSKLGAAVGLENPVEEEPEEAYEDMESEETPNKSSFDVRFSELLSNNVRKSAAGAIIRGPPAARHFGGNRGGLSSSGHVHYGSKCDGVSPIAICGADKSVVWFSDRDPPGRTYPIGASGAVLSDVMDEQQSEYMCCFLAKEKRMVVFELSRKTVVVELQMKTKLNFWRYLPSESHGSDLAFMLITPIGGFHWKPLDESPRPCQVWKRGPELESKKILAYEEGGSNGQPGADARSTVALVIASSATPRSTTVEAYCIAMNSGSRMLCISNVVLGAALYQPPSTDSLPQYTLPNIVIISKDVTSRLIMDIEDLREESDNLVGGDIVASAVLDLGDEELDESYDPPSMSMGPSPEVLCCCNDGFIVTAVRRKGLVFAFDFSDGDLTLIGKSNLGQYVVDVAIRSGNVDGEAELILLLCENDDQKDGRIASVNISRVGELDIQYLSSI